MPLRIRASGWPQVNQLAIRERTECESGEKGRLGCESFGDYCLERLGFSESTAKQRVRLEKRLRELPQLRQALLSGRITYTKALVVARSATPADVAEKIAASAETTWQQVDREAREEEDRADRAASRRKIHGPRVAMRLVEDAVESARQFFASRGEPIDAGEALARVADHFVARYEVPLRRAEWRRKWEKDVLLRQGGLCAVPGCTRAAEHVHHIVYRSRGGPDVPWNCLGVCARHHYWAIHRDRLTVRGRGGEYLIWRVRDSELVPYEEFVTCGTDDVRRAGAAFDFCTGQVRGPRTGVSP